MSTTEDYDVLIRPYEAQMIQSIGRIIPDPDRAEEVLQESVLKIWDRRERIKVHPNPKAYVLSTCITVALDELRRLKRHQDAKRVMLAEGRHRRAQSDPSDAVMAKEVEEAVMASISKLSSQQATAVLLRLV
ncbi:MAG: hypothetical protein FJ267_13370, partial [Planctomycetes bacterium]|nr:hypothetical protein [Planctomycetota bacterium]